MQTREDPAALFLLYLGQGWSPDPRSGGRGAGFQAGRRLGHQRKQAVGLVLSSGPGSAAYTLVALAKCLSWAGPQFSLVYSDGRGGI